MLQVAACEVAGDLLDGHGVRHATVRVWQRFGAIVCDLHHPAGTGTDPFLGYRAPGPAPAPGDGLWLARQLCDSVEVRSGDRGRTVRLNVPGPQAVELLQP